MDELRSTPAFYSARPSVSIDGQENSDLTLGLLTLLVEETITGLYRCEATFGNWGTGKGEVGFLYFDRQLLDFGKTLSIYIGERDSEAQIFEGRVMGLEAYYPKMRPPEIAILAEDRFQDLRMTRRTRTFENVNDKDIIEQIASEHSLKTDIDIDGPTYQIIAQVNQSDLSFLRERARAVDAEVWMEDDLLHAQAHSRRDEGKITLTYGKRLIEFSVLADLATQRTSLTMSGWNVSAKEGIEYKATESAIRGELNGGQSGSSELNRAFGERIESVVHMVPFTAQETQYLAESFYRTMTRRFVTGNGLAEGDGRIRVGTYVDLKGLGRLFDGPFYVTEVRHTFDGQNGFRTNFAVERPGLGSA